jgi:predicted transcriptional regulator
MQNTKITAADVWRAVVAGNTTSRDIADALGVSRSHAAIYLRVMSEVGLLNSTLVQISHSRGSGMTYVYKPDYDTAQALGW